MAQHIDTFTADQLAAVRRCARGDRQRRWLPQLTSSYGVAPFHIAARAVWVVGCPLTSEGERAWQSFRNLAARLTALGLYVGVEPSRVRPDDPHYATWRAEWWVSDEERATADALMGDGGWTVDDAVQAAAALAGNHQPTGQHALPGLELAGAR